MLCFVILKTRLNSKKDRKTHFKNHATRSARKMITTIRRNASAFLLIVIFATCGCVIINAQMKVPDAANKLKEHCRKVFACNKVHKFALNSRY